MSSMNPDPALDQALNLHRQGKLREAFERYAAILAEHPDHAAALHFSGVVLHQSGDHDGAVERIRKSIFIDGAPAEPWANLAHALAARGNREAAINALKEAAARAPRDAEIWSNLAASELGLGRLDDAERSAREAIAADPRHAHGWYNLAQVLEPQGRILEALDAAGRAAAIAPDEAAPAGFRAQLQQQLGQLDAARRTLEAALARHPAVAPLHGQLGSVLERLGDPAAAARAHASALRLEPDNGAALAPLVFLRKRMCDWREIGSLQRRFRDGVAAGWPFLTPFSFLSDPSSRSEQRQCAERWSATMVRAAGGDRRPLSEGRLRIGYLSGDFYDHPTAVLAAGVFEAHDRARIAIAGYSTGPDDGSAMRSRVAGAFDRFVDAREWPAPTLAKRIRDDGIDLLIDLKGHTEGAPLEVLALRPAPLQVHWLGYPGTLGAPFVDYLIGDRIVTPLAEAADYSETLVQLPGSYQSNDRSRVAGPAVSRADLGLPEGAFVFCCFNQTYKLNPAVLDAWARILEAVPGGVLWLLARGGDDPALAHLRREVEARGVAPARLVFAARRPQPDYLALYRHADLFLDTWPYNAHTTATDALWEGCPVLTVRGETFAGRVASSLLHAVGLPELVAATVDDYVAAAAAIASDPVRRARLVAHLSGAGRTSSLFDVAAFTRGLEAAYFRIAEQYRAGRRSPIAIAPDDR